MTRANGSQSIPLTLNPREWLGDVSWPTHAAVPLPEGFATASDQFGLFENGHLIPSQAETVATWVGKKSPKWLHVFASFVYRNGQPAKYELRKLDERPRVSATALRVVEENGTWVVDTGVSKFSVDRRRFTGFRSLAIVQEQQTHVADFAADVGGPYLTDEKGVVHHCKFDPKAEVIIEQQGACQVVLRAEGWYSPIDPRSRRFARFVTRIIACANSSIIKVHHATILVESMKQRRILDLGFSIPLKTVGPTTFGIDGKTASISNQRPLFLHQQSPTHCRYFTTDSDNAQGKRLDGWFATTSGEVAVVTHVKDFWQKYPNEFEVGPAGITYHFWPKNGEDVFTLKQQLDPRNITQQLAFHHGKELNLNLPVAYFEQLKSNPEMAENRPEQALDSDAEGIAITSEFAIACVSKDKADDATTRHQLYLANPIALASPEWIAASQAFGTIAVKSESFAAVEETIESGLLGFADPEKLNDYGKFNYGDVHHTTYPAEHRASLHRNWFTNHYHSCSSPWVLVARGGSKEMLDWARRNTDHYSSIDQSRRTADPGGFWHKGYLHWAGAPSGKTGHWPDPTGLLYSWLIDANYWAKEGYELWLRDLKFPYSGSGREVSSSLVTASVAYEHTHNPEFLRAIKGMFHGISAVPLEQQTGSIWNPFWISRAYELIASPEAARYLIDSAERMGLQHEGISSMTLCASAYYLTHDRDYLTRHLPVLARVIRKLYRKKASHWNKFGISPGPAQDFHLIMQWPYFLAALQEAGIKELPKDDEVGCYPHAYSRRESPNDTRGCSVLVLKQDERQPLEIKLEAWNVSGGDIHNCAVTMVAPNRRPFLTATFPDPETDRTAFRPSGEQIARRKWSIAEAASSGLYEIRFSGYQLSIYQPLTSHPEAALLKNHRLTSSAEPVVHASKSSSGYLVPLVDEPIKLTFEAKGRTEGTRIQLIDAKGGVLINTWLLLGDEATKSVILNPRDQKQPTWYLDIYSPGDGYYHLTVEGPGRVDGPLLFGRSLAHLRKIAEQLDPRAPTQDERK